MAEAYSPLQIRLVNGLTEDPAVYAFHQPSGEAFSFDLGNLEPLTPKDVLRLRHFFVSHTHVDHFIGFDRVLRANIPHFRTLSLHGPVGLSSNVQGKLRGYNWNLVEADQISFQVTEIDREGRVRRFHITNTSDFAIEEIPLEWSDSTIGQPKLPAARVCQFAHGAEMHAIALDHGTDSIAFFYQEPARFKVRDHQLTREQLNPGPWIRELQTAAAQGDLDTVIDPGSGPERAASLKERFLELGHSSSYGYVTDIAFTRDNLDRLKTLLLKPDLLICESNFAAEDSSKAQEKKHLTTKQAALIAANVNARRLQTFHYSKLYSQNPDLIQNEGQTYFADFTRLRSAALKDATESAHCDH